MILNSSYGRAHYFLKNPQIVKLDENEGLQTVINDVIPSIGVI
jgi:hypothetical protein